MTRPDLSAAWEPRKALATPADMAGQRLVDAIDEAFKVACDQSGIVWDMLDDDEIRRGKAYIGARLLGAPQAVAAALSGRQPRPRPVEAPRASQDRPRRRRSSQARQGRGSVNVRAAAAGDLRTRMVVAAYEVSPLGTWGAFQKADR